jgi:hypothetical protein
MVCSKRLRKVKNQSAAVPFGPFFFGLVPSSFAITSIAQQFSRDHAQSFPIHGISISIPSLLTADPNFNGHVFLDGIKKSWLYRNEPFFSIKTRANPSCYTLRPPILSQPQTVLGRRPPVQGWNNNAGPFIYHTKPFLPVRIDKKSDCIFYSDQKRTTTIQKTKQ